jgi:phospholipid/cholesterol/gamma-HCH transport system ATP-binding protein
VKWGLYLLSCCSRDGARKSRQAIVPVIDVRRLEIGYDSDVLVRGITFTVAPTEIMVIMGGSGSGKSTLMKYLVGLKLVEKGEIFYNGHSFSHASPEVQEEIQRGFGVLFQGSALWSG